MVGLYGVKSYVVSQRTREIGLRMALGAERADVLWLVLRGGLVMTGAGLLFGGLLSVATARLLAGLLYEGRTFDPLVFALAPLLLAGSAPAGLLSPGATGHPGFADGGFAPGVDARSTVVRWSVVRWGRRRAELLKFDMTRARLVDNR